MPRHPVACAIRAQAAVMLGLDLEDEGDALVGSLVSTIFLYCYFYAYFEEINILLAAQGYEPIDFGGAKSSQVSDMANHMNDLLAEAADNGKFAVQPGFFAKLSNFASGLDTGREMGYNDSSESNPAGGSGPDRGGAGGPDIGALNPIRYRGYYYDTETGYYFLQTRYYSPQWRRFINADCMFIAGDALTGSNMYAYCNNNPVMYCDPSGMAPFSINDPAEFFKWLSWLGQNFLWTFGDDGVNFFLQVFNGDLLRDWRNNYGGLVELYILTWDAFYSSFGNFTTFASNIVSGLNETINRINVWLQSQRETAKPLGSEFMKLFNTLLGIGMSLTPLAPFATLTKALIDALVAFGNITKS
jgi:RHS repeat-associated protein